MATLRERMHRRGRQVRARSSVRAGQLIWNEDWADSFDDRLRKTEDHWLWTGYVDQNDGYGRFHPGHDVPSMLAHRVAYVRWIGPIPDDRPVIDHLGHPFQLRRCVRPACLEAITHEENIRRGDSPAGRNVKKTHCPGCGSEYNETNTHTRPSGERICRICRNNRKAKLRAEAKAEASG